MSGYRYQDKPRSQQPYGISVKEGEAVRAVAVHRVIGPESFTQRMSRLIQDDQRKKLSPNPSPRRPGLRVDFALLKRMEHERQRAAQLEDQMKDLEQQQAAKLLSLPVDPNDITSPNGNHNPALSSPVTPPRPIDLALLKRTEHEHQRDAELLSLPVDPNDVTSLNGNRNPALSSPATLPRASVINSFPLGVKSAGSAGRKPTPLKFRDGNCAMVMSQAAPTLVEGVSNTKVLEPREEALQDLRRALGLTRVMGDLPIRADDFNEPIELRTEQEVNKYIEKLERAAHVAGYVRIATPDLTPPNSPPTTPRVPMRQHAMVFEEE